MPYIFWICYEVISIFLINQLTTKMMSSSGGDMVVIVSRNSKVVTAIPATSTGWWTYTKDYNTLQHAQREIGMIGMAWPNALGRGSMTTRSMRGIDLALVALLTSIVHVFVHVITNCTVLDVVCHTLLICVLTLLPGAYLPYIVITDSAYSLNKYISHRHCECFPQLPIRKQIFRPWINVTLAVKYSHYLCLRACVTMSWMQSTWDYIIKCM